MTARRYIADIIDPTTGQASQIVASNQTDLDTVLDELYPPIDPNTSNSADTADTADNAEPSCPGMAGR